MFPKLKKKYFCNPKLAQNKMFPSLPDIGNCGTLIWKLVHLDAKDSLQHRCCVRLGDSMNVILTIDPTGFMIEIAFRQGEYVFTDKDCWVRRLWDYKTVTPWEVAELQKSIFASLREPDRVTKLGERCPCEKKTMIDISGLDKAYLLFCLQKLRRDVHIIVDNNNVNDTPLPLFQRTVVLDLSGDSVDPTDFDADCIGNNKLATFQDVANYTQKTWDDTKRAFGADPDQVLDAIIRFGPK